MGSPTAPAATADFDLRDHPVPPASGDWHVSVAPYQPMDDLRRLAWADPNLPAVLATWEQLVAPITAAGMDGDNEDALEQMYRLHAATVAVPLEHLWVQVGRDAAKNAATGESYPGDERLMFRWGSQHRFVGPIPGLRVEHQADQYASLRSFQRHAGRRSDVCGWVVNRAAGQTDILDVLATYAGSRAFVKVNRAKYGVAVLDIPVGATAATIPEIFWSRDLLAGAALHLEGRPDGFVVQDVTEMLYEYRLFVVDGEAVTGAGCIVEHTPADNVGATFDDRVQRIRYESPIVRDAQVRDLLVSFGRMVAAEIADEAPELTDYSLDVALGADGAPLVIELNGIRNSGLYASRPELITQAMRGRTDG